MNMYYSISSTIDERAMAFFSTHYIVDAESRPSNFAGYAIDDNLSSCMKAVGLAAMASTTHSRELIKEVRYLDRDDQMGNSRWILSESSGKGKRLREQHPLLMNLIPLP